MYFNTIAPKNHRSSLWHQSTHRNWIVCPHFTTPPSTLAGRCIVHMWPREAARLGLLPITELGHWQRLELISGMPPITSGDTDFYLHFLDVGAIDWVSRRTPKNTPTGTWGKYCLSLKNTPQKLASRTNTDYLTQVKRTYIYFQFLLIYKHLQTFYLHEKKQKKL
jgi:hypothetical protein